jgi:ABC-2 type transport system ATP-binding protein
MLVELEEVRRDHGSVRALDRVSGQLDGQIIGLLGPNGAGKSTLIRCMLGLLSFEGELRVLGRSCRREALEIRDRVGYMPENDSYLPGLSAVELCAYAAELSGLPRSEALQRAHTALYHVNLEEKRYLPVDGYSTGMKQRVKLAQALVHDPALLLLDEPTNGLDPRARAEMLELIAELPRRRGCAVLLSTHLLDDAEQVCDHVAILHRGRLRFSGALAALRDGGGAAAAPVYQVELRDASAPLEAALAGLGCAVEASGRQLTVTLPAALPPSSLFAAARGAGAQIRHLALRRRSLQEAFLALVEQTVEQAP